MNRPDYCLRARGLNINLGGATKIMGVLNCSPDSFSGDGRSSLAASLKHARKLIAEGADIIDIGGESTRPGAPVISVKEELRRVVPVVKALSHKLKTPLSVDTSKLEVARQALASGACIINNVRGLYMNKEFLKMVRDYDAGVVIMHMRGTPKTMQRYARYKNVMGEIIEELMNAVEKCLSIGIKKDKIIIDPGIGFSKTLEQNLVIIKNLSRLNVLHLPILLGTSRKSFIGKILQKQADNRLMGTTASVTAGVLQGAHIVRVHDVKEIKESLKVTDAILHACA